MTAQKRKKKTAKKTKQPPRVLLGPSRLDHVWNEVWDVMMEERRYFSNKRFKPLFGISPRELDSRLEALTATILNTVQRALLDKNIRRLGYNDTPDTEDVK